MRRHAPKVATRLRAVEEARYARKSGRIRRSPQGLEQRIFQRFGLQRLEHASAQFGLAQASGCWIDGCERLRQRLALLDDAVARVRHFGAEKTARTSPNARTRRRASAARSNCRN